MKKLSSLCLIAAMMLGCAATRHVRYTPARWVDELDQEPIEAPRVRPEYSISDAFEYHILYQFERLLNLPLRAERGLHAMGLPTLQEALNTNNFDEVSDSSWFTNRLGRKKMTTEELRRGPNQTEGPDPAGPWTVMSGKSTGVSPGFMIKDAKGEKYFIKFDPPGHLELTTSAEVIGTKIMHAMGYYVPETYIVDFHPQILKISPDATARDRHGKKVPFTEENLTELFRKVGQKGNGYYRAVASRFIEGKPLGPFSLRGIRQKDKNDRIPHEHRRELRGYRVVSSLINNSDTREGNTLDSFIETGPGEKGYIRHYIIDFSSSLGAASDRAKTKEHTDDYYFNLKKISASFFSLGIYQPDWEKIPDSNLESVGIFDHLYFRPEKWRPVYMNPGFQNMTVRDAFWATKILMQLSDADLRAIVEEGKYSDPAATEYVTKALIERRKKIGEYWFSKINPLDNFELIQNRDGVQIDFDDLMITSGLQPEGSATYRYRLVQTGGIHELVPWVETSGTSAVLHSEALARMKEDKRYLLQLETRRDGERSYGPTVDVILQRKETTQILGLNRRY